MAYAHYLNAQRVPELNQVFFWTCDQETGSWSWIGIDEDGLDDPALFNTVENQLLSKIMEINNAESEAEYG